MVGYMSFFGTRRTNLKPSVTQVGVRRRDHAGTNAGDRRKLDTRGWRGARVSECPLYHTAWQGLGCTFFPMESLSFQWHLMQKHEYYKMM
jgi:hypothetical protein